MFSLERPSAIARLVLGEGRLVVAEQLEALQVVAEVRAILIHRYQQVASISDHILDDSIALELLVHDDNQIVAVVNALKESKIMLR